MVPGVGHLVRGQDHLHALGGGPLHLNVLLRAVAKALEVVTLLTVGVDDLPPLVEEVVGRNVHGVRLHRDPHRWL
jgi:hypothetical protein